MRANLLYLVGTQIFVDTSATYTYIMYLRFFADLEQASGWNWGYVCLAYLYTKLTEADRWKMRHITGSMTLLTV